MCVPGRGIVTPPGASPHGVYIDGREEHLSQAFTGRRYSVVAFVHSTATALSSSARQWLVKLGFRLPVRAMPDVQRLVCDDGVPSGGASTAELGVKRSNTAELGPERSVSQYNLGSTTSDMCMLCTTGLLACGITRSNVQCACRKLSKSRPTGTGTADPTTSRDIDPRRTSVTATGSASHDTVCRIPDLAEHRKSGFSACGDSGSSVCEVSDASECEGSSPSECGDTGIDLRGVQRESSRPCSDARRCGSDEVHARTRVENFGSACRGRSAE